MDFNLAKAEELTILCLQADVEAGVDALSKALKQIMPELDFSCVLTRGNWYRLGGVVDKEYQQISDNLTLWAENECEGDVDEIILKHVDSGYFATRLAGKTHYFTACCGSRAEDFIQLEIEELQQVIDRPLVDQDWFPDSLEEFVDPLDFPRLEPEAIAKPYFQFRRLSDIQELLDAKQLEKRSSKSLLRFFQDWNQSSGMESQPFCRHWILALREYKNSNSEIRLSAKPVSTFAGEVPELPPGEKLEGSQLSQAIHCFDRVLGYPFAWYFAMLTSKSSHFRLAEAVLKDQMGAYDYLPAREVKVLRQWERQPYGI